MSHMIYLYKLVDGQTVNIEMTKIRKTLDGLTSEDLSDYDGGEAYISFKGLKPVQKPQPKSNFFLSFFRKNEPLTEQNKQEIDADEHSIAFNRPQEGFETAMFQIMYELDLIAIRDESFCENSEAIISLNSLERENIPDEIDTMPTKNMDLVLIKSASELLEQLYC